MIISWSGTDGNTVSGNYIGTDAAGTQELGITLDGVKIEAGAENNIIGGQSAAERNIIAASTMNGVRITGNDTDGNTVSYNYIGSDVTGAQDKGNAYNGVRIDGGAQDNTVGPNNHIAHNFLRGVYVDDSGTTGNTITENSIHSNGSLGIELNDGGNGGISAPTVSSADGCLSISGTAGAGDMVEVFTGPDEEGKTYLAADGSANTSQFSTAVEAHCYPAFLPLAVRNY